MKFNFHTQWNISRLASTRTRMLHKLDFLARTNPNFLRQFWGTAREVKQKKEIAISRFWIGVKDFLFMARLNYCTTITAFQLTNKSEWVCGCLSRRGSESTRQIWKYERKQRWNYTVPWLHNVTIYEEQQNLLLTRPGCLLSLGALYSNVGSFRMWNQVSWKLILATWNPISMPRTKLPMTETKNWRILIDTMRTC